MMARIAEADAEGRRLARRRAEMGDMLMRAADAFEEADATALQQIMGMPAGWMELYPVVTGGGETLNSTTLSIQMPVPASLLATENWTGRGPVELVATGVYNSTVMSAVHFPLDLSELRSVPDSYPYPFAPFSSNSPDGLIEFLLEPLRHLLPNFKVSTGEDSITLRLDTMLFDRELELGWKEHVTALTGSPMTVSPSAIRLAGTETFWVERDFLRDVWTMAFISACIEHRLAEDIMVQTRTQILNSVNITDQPGVMRSALSMEIPFAIISENSSYTAVPYIRYSQNGYLRRATALAADVSIVFVLAKLAAVAAGAGAVEAVRQLAPTMP